ncbi:WhiB family transcriptional regulator [Pseudonocardia sulfidoxydans]|uniref:WhiB family transcriptional regulator n=2 Tax=Pseudonocardia sulfidoxydans TaxID=54011 RepID=UPI0035ECC164
MTAARNEVRNWRADALCVQIDPDLFFPETDRGTAFDRQVTAAKRVCAGCPVRAQCLDYALEALPDGIAGGTTPAERTALRHRLGVELVDVRAGLLPPDGQRERAAAGRRAAAAGADASELMRRFGVVRETAQRWRADAHRTSRTRTPGRGVEEGSPAATGAPLRISTARQALAGNTAPEGHRP